MAGTYAAVDLGAESGRVVLGKVEDGRVELKELHRFRNGPVRVGGHMHWDVLRLWEEILTGLAAAVREDGRLSSIGVDTWGVDYGLLDRNGALLGNPHHYRDHRTDGMPERLFARVPLAEVFAATGIQFMQLNTLYQLYAMVEERSPMLDVADRLLFTPDLFHYWLCGEKVGEYTIATTSQCYDVAGQAWATRLLERLGIPSGMFPPLVQPGTRLGRVLTAVADRIGAAGIEVVAPGAHDTASAVAAVPARTDRYAYISSGTWSLMGAVVPSPVVNETARSLAFTNEGGVAGTVRLLKNIAGLWPVQECRRAWARAGEELGYDALTAMAAAAPPFRTVIDPDHASFLAPDDMPGAIAAYCSRTGQAPPESRGVLVRAILEGLGYKYRRTLENLERLLGQRLEVIHIVGGGSQNQLLCQVASDACGRPVLAGPVEATAIGNVLAQAITAGALSSWEQAREVVRTTFPLRSYEPTGAAAWDEAIPRMQRILEGGHR
ncbi:MAG TPA: rhamnulokinase family protein [Anaeromyxobacter sp.]|nr:rhamnulokinase family protein [Anaeromyxobacter sp.]